jgi:uncharacterized protein YqfA (UPF0365 family)
MIEQIGSLGVVIAAIVLLIIMLYFVPIGLWFSALVSGVKISLLQLFLMRFRKVPPGVIVRALIEGTKAGVHLNRDALEAHYLAGGHVARVTHALVSAAKANIELTWQQQLTLPDAMFLKPCKCQ